MNQEDLKPVIIKQEATKAKPVASKERVSEETANNESIEALTDSNKEMIYSQIVQMLTTIDDIKERVRQLSKMAEDITNYILPGISNR